MATIFRSANKHHMRRRDSLSPALNNKTAARFNLLRATKCLVHSGHLMPSTSETAKIDIIQKLPFSLASIETIPSPPLALNNLCTGGIQFDKLSEVPDKILLTSCYFNCNFNVYICYYLNITKYSNIIATETSENIKKNITSFGGNNITKFIDIQIIANTLILKLK